MPAVPKLTGWLSRRRTVREYDADATIPDEEIRAILDAGRKAPTSGTIQMYSFVSVRDPEMRARIHEAAGGGQPRIEEATSSSVSTSVGSDCSTTTATSSSRWRR
ncbi:hypothetical protein D8S78_22260 [Natrialba swarupiae]|nr:hypothetical protein [Natrialba swarupiae]